MLGSGSEQQQRDYGSNLAAELSKTSRKATERQREVAQMADCADLDIEGRLVKPDSSKAPQLFSELDNLLQKQSTSGMPVPVHDRVKTFEKDMSVLLKTVASDSELLRSKYHEDIASPSGQGQSRELDVTERTVEFAVPEESNQPRVDPFPELGTYLDRNGDALEEHHRVRASAISTRMNALVGCTLQNCGDTVSNVDRILRGEEGEDAHTLDKEHAAWRKSTLQTLKKSPAGSKANRLKGRRATVASVPRSGLLLPPTPEAALKEASGRSVQRSASIAGFERMRQGHRASAAA